MNLYVINMKNEEFLEILSKNEKIMQINRMLISKFHKGKK